MLADSLQYDIPNDEIWAKGDVTLRRGLDWISGPEVKFYREREIGYFEEPRFYMSENGAHGEAKEIRFTGPDLYEATDAQYTSCIAPNNDWYLRSDEIEVDKLRKIGTAHNAKVYFLDVPVMYTPWLEFPLSNERKSGFLTPTIGSTQIRGFEIAAPYYFNLAPNYDATVSPRLMTRRGLQIAGQGRYLFERAAGESIGEVVPDDRVTDDTRWAFSWKHNQTVRVLAYRLRQLQPRVRLHVSRGLRRPRCGHVAKDVAGRSRADRQLRAVHIAGPRAVVSDAAGSESGRRSRASLQHAAAGEGGHGRYRLAGSHVERHRRVHQVLAVGIDADRRSRIVLSSGALAAARQRMVRQRAPGRLRMAVRSQPAGEPAARWHAQASRCRSRASTRASSSSATGIIFGTNFIQTLEPRAMYTYIPFRSQNQLPVFDTVLDDFNFTQLFSENRFIGGDRVGDTNQLAIAVTSRLLDPATGAERFRLAVGQRFYFEDQQVNLPGTTPQMAGSSDFLVGAEGRLLGRVVADRAHAV